jgi:hypothetical protein
MGAEEGGFMFKGENGVIKKQRGKVRSLPVLETILEYLFEFVKGCELRFHAFHKVGIMLEMSISKAAFG